MKDTNTKNIKTLVFEIMNTNDPLETFEVEASGYNEAMQKAMDELGWMVCEGREADDDENED